MFYHLYNRVAGDPGWRPFGRVEKEHFVHLLKRLTKLYDIHVMAYQVMSTHFHIVAHVPSDPPTPDEAARRYAAYYRGRRKLDPNSSDAAAYALRLNDISWFMHDLQQQFASWFNRTRKTRRRGGLWADRFKNTLLEEGEALWCCINYVEMNAVRAGMVGNPADYRFCSYGEWCGRGHHPFAEQIIRHLLPALKAGLGIADIESLRTAQATAFGESGVAEDHAGSSNGDGPFSPQVTRKVRYWVDGLLIGSEGFIRRMALQLPEQLQVDRPLVRAHGSGGDLAVYNRLRTA
jgi:hypothetical protein